MNKTVFNPALPLRDIVVFPGMIVPLFVGRDKSITALENINLTVEKNEFVCVMGTSGCGKTTLLNVIAGFIKPSKGQILLKGKN